MNDETSGRKERLPRHRIQKPVRASGKGVARDGNVRDISGSGAALDIDPAWDEDELLDLDIDDIGEMSGRIARSFEDGIGVRFVDLDEEEEEDLVEDLARLEEMIRLEDE
jgi:hypothetical protein